MKSLYLSVILIFLGITSSFSQTPNLFNYQAIVRDVTGQVVDNQSVGIKISILQGTSTGSTVFSETHAATTNNYGLVNLQIGNGTNFGPQLNTVLWGTDLYFIKVEIDPAGGVAYSISSTSQLISVPYALHAETVAQNDDADADPANENNTTAILNGTDLEITDGGGMLIVDLSSLVDDADANPINEIQTITKVGSIITLSLGGGAVTDDVNDADANPVNELNTGATLVGTTLNITDAGGTIPVDLSSLGNDADANPANEMNSDVTLVGTTLNVIDAGSTQSVDLASLGNDADANPANEMNSDVTLVGTTLNVIDAGSTQFVSLTSLANTDVTFVGTTLNVIDGVSTQSVNLASLGNDADANPANEMNSDVTLVGTTLNVIDGGSTQSVDLVSLGNDADANPANEMNSAVTLVGTTLNVIDGGSTQSVDLATLGNDADADPANELQTLSLVGSDLSISGGNTITLGGGTDSQTLSLVGNDLTILNGNTVTLPAGGGTDTQTLSLVGTNLTISTGNTVDLVSLGDDADANPLNEMNSGVTLVGTTLNVIDGGSTQSVDLISLGNDADANPTNEMNTGVTLVGTMLNVIDAGSTQSVDLASLGGGTDSQTLSIAGADITISGGNTITIPVATHHVGEHFGGGIIVWVDSTGQHGIICGYADLAGTYAFQTGNTANLITSNMTNGAINTPLIIAGPSGPYPAAVAADACADGGFTDWYLPAAYELELLLMSNYVLGQYALLRGGTNFYWSSSQDPAAAGVNAYRALGGPISISSFGEANVYRVRCVRAF